LDCDNFPNVAQRGSEAFHASLLISPFSGMQSLAGHPNSWLLSRERAMSTQMQSRAGQVRRGVQALSFDSDTWVWSVIFTSAALTGLFIATIFVVAV
jgi:hypothetical protein